MFFSPRIKTISQLAGILLLVCFAAVVNAQQTASRKIEDVLADYEDTDQVQFFYKKEWIKDIRIDDTKRPLKDFLKNVLPKFRFTHSLYQEKYIILFPITAAVTTPEAIQQDATDFKADDRNHTITGTIKDANSGEAIIGASVQIDELKNGTVTNTSGFFTLTLKSGLYNLTITAIGKTPVTQRVRLDRNQNIDIELYEKVVQLKDIVVTAESMDQNLSSPSMSSMKLTASVMRKLPAFMGEVDVIKSIRLLPGVTTVGEGAGGFNVRGGNVDQNLILMDDAPIFNSSHLFGFFSTFNSDIVKDVTLQKGGIPAQYGGRLSSVLDVRLLNGNAKDFQVSGGVGILSSRLKLEGPIIKDKTTFIVAGRYAYPDWILDALNNVNLKNSNGFFYDLNAKVSHKINETNNIQASAYASEDGFKFASDTSYYSKSFASSLRWNSVIHDKFFLSASAFYSDYNYGVEGLKQPSTYTADFGLLNYGGKIDLSYTPNPDHRLDVGVSGSTYEFNPGQLTANVESTINPIDLQNEYANEYGVYAGLESRLNDRISFSAGVRFSLYENIGRSDVFIYENGRPKSPATIVDTVSYDKGQAIKRYQGIEPRFSAKYSLGENTSLKLSYNRTMQYIHLISNTAAISPIDLWKSSNTYVKPQIADQIALGLFKNFPEKGIETSLEVYYKRIDNLVEYKDGAQLFLNTAVESALLSATGLNYGAEVLVKKNSGRFTGWVSYTYSRTFRKVKGNSTTETVNQGKYYPSNFDKPNDLSVVANYKFTRRISFSSNFTYSTGRAITYPESIYIVDGYAVSQYSARNQGRTPDYHRLDISLTIDEALKKKQRWKGSWTFGIYNVYARKNPYSVFFKPQFAGKQVQAYRLAVLGTILPSITYSFKF